MVKTTSRTECLVFAEILDADLWVCARAVLDEVAEYGLVVVADDKNFVNLRDTSDCLEAVLDDWVASDLEEWL